MILSAETINSVDLLEYVSQYTTFERRNGEYWAISPLTNEVTPSFSIDATRRVYYDFSSGSNGNIISFIRDYNRCSTGKAFSILQEYLGLKDGDEVEDKRLAASSVAMKFKPKESKAKLSSASTLSDNYMDIYDRDPRWLCPWFDEGISMESMRKFNVAYDAFSNRIVFPIRDLAGHIINVSGRTLDPDFKEKKLRKYTYFKPLGTLNTIYGFFENKDAIMDKKEIIIFEGAKSVMKADAWGVQNTGAILTSHLNENQMRILVRLGVAVVFALDKDVEPWKDRNIKRLLQFIPVYYIYDKHDFLDDKMAPVDKGLNLFKTLYADKKALRK